jgi:ABC-type transport system involved in multi-copper enzyme maturation permease subunit
MSTIFNSKLLVNLLVALIVTCLTFILNHAGELGIPGWVGAVLSGIAVSVNAFAQEYQAKPE